MCYNSSFHCLLFNSLSPSQTPDSVADAWSSVYRRIFFPNATHPEATITVFALLIRNFTFPSYHLHELLIQFTFPFWFDQSMLHILSPTCWLIYDFLLSWPHSLPYFPFCTAHKVGFPSRRRCFTNSFQLRLYIAITCGMTLDFCPFFLWSGWLTTIHQFALHNLLLLMKRLFCSLVLPLVFLSCFGWRCVTNHQTKIQPVNGKNELQNRWSQSSVICTESSSFQWGSYVTQRDGDNIKPEKRESMSSQHFGKRQHVDSHVHYSSAQPALYTHNPKYLWPDGLL